MPKPLPPLGLSCAKKKSAEEQVAEKSKQQAEERAALERANGPAVLGEIIQSIMSMVKCYFQSFTVE